MKFIVEGCAGVVGVFMSADTVGGAEKGSCWFADLLEAAIPWGSGVGAPDGAPW